MGGSSDLCALLKPGEPVMLMGPTGTPTEIHADTTVALVGGGLGNAVLFCIGAAMRAAGSRVIYFAGYKKLRDRYKVEEIERAADVDRLVLRRGAGLRAARPQDRPSSATSCRRWRRTASGGSASSRDPARRGRPHDRHRLGPHDAGGRRARGTACWRRICSPDHTAIGSINSPMQCMMKEICAQCLQPHVDPATGERDGRVLLLQSGPAARPRRFPRLHERLSQNGVQEKLTAQWVDRALHRLQARPAVAAE